MREVRRKDRILQDAEAEELLRNGEYGFLSMVNVDGGGYGIPLSYALCNGSIYFHCAPEGHKLDNLAADNRVTFTVIGATRVVPEKFTTAYRSVIAFGTVTSVASDAERLQALRLLVDKYSPAYAEVAEKYIKGSFARTHILRLDIDGISAKAKKIEP